MSQTEKPLFSVSNRHSKVSGTPPHIDGNVWGKYHGYFENEHGEQAVFVYDRATKTGLLWLGDSSWDSPHKVVDGLARAVILSKHEEMWLQACWNAATEFEKYEDK
jgi:hypothetical protein